MVSSRPVSVRDTNSEFSVSGATCVAFFDMSLSIELALNTIGWSPSRLTTYIVPSRTSM